ncbi:AAA family ATPase [Kineococcus glutinatus]|uniref:AAA domain-containing protein n=1 Tax=Kineococcus glutinatus TaxID=1070872 RepID=A0ABP8VDE9_9ACTN
MIIWINGAFGVGKSTTACEVLSRLPDAGVFDPERWGWVLKRTVGLFRPGDYQDLESWRAVTIATAARRARPGRHLVVPMSVLNTEHLVGILQGLRRRGREVLHVTLHASSAELEERIAADADDIDARAWRTGQLARYEAAAAALGDLGPVVHTDGLRPQEVADAVVALALRRQPMPEGALVTSARARWHSCLALPDRIRPRRGP